MAYFLSTDRLLCLVLVIILTMTPSLSQAQWQRVSPSLIGGNTGSIFAFGSSLFVSTDSDVFRTTDDGSSWFSAKLRDSVGVLGFFASLGAALFYGSETGICISMDNGGSWHLSSLNRKGPEAILGLASIDNTRLFAASDWDNLVYSDDFGSTWYLASTNIGTSHFHNVKTVGNLVFAQGEGDVTFNHTGGVVRSSDGGNSWQRVALQNNIIDYGGIGDRVFFSGGDSSFYESDDDGLTWKARPEVIPDSVGFACFLTYNSIVLGGSYPGVYVSLDSGATWISKDDGIPSTAQGIVSLAIQDNYIFAATADSGVWRAPLLDFQNLSGVAGNASVATPIYLSPNPTSGLVTVRCAAGSIMVTNVLGQVALTASAQPGESLTLNLNSEPAGIYFVRVDNATARVVVAH